MNILHRRFVRQTAAGLIAAAMAVSACAEGIVPVHAEVSAIQDSSKAIYFDGSFELELAPEVKEVLERGVPLNFNLEVEIFKNRWYISVSSASASLRLLVISSILWIRRRLSIYRTRKFPQSTKEYQSN